MKTLNPEDVLIALKLPVPISIKEYKQKIDARILKAELSNDCSEETISEVVKMKLNLDNMYVDWVNTVSRRD